MQMKKLILGIGLVMTLVGCGQMKSKDIDISSGNLRKEVFALVSNVENSTIDFEKTIWPY